MKILLLSFYYAPDLSAGSFRASALVKALLASFPKGTCIEVLTTSPNRYISFAANAAEQEKQEYLLIRRIGLPSHQSGFIDQSKAFLTYSREVAKHVASQNYDLVIGTSSRLMTASLAAYVANKTKAILYLDIRDIFVDTLKDVFPRWVTILAKPVFSLLERWTIGRAIKVNLVSQGFEGYFKARYPNKAFSFYTNGIDDEFLLNNITTRSEVATSNEKKTLTVLYAGNIGEGQGLHNIIPDLALATKNRLEFRVIGDGGRKKVLSSSLLSIDVTNVTLLPPVKREALIDEYRKADILFLHLNNYDAFKKVLPSKIFEYAAMGKPIWAGVSGYAAEFIRKEVSNAVVFEPCDASQAVSVFTQLTLKDSPRLDFLNKYARANIMMEMALDIRDNSR